MLEKLLKKGEIKFITAFVSFVFIFLIIIFALAFIVDPHNDFGTNIFQPLVLTNRTEKLEALENISPKPKVLIFGSSRVYEMDPELIEKITKKPAYNASVSWARPEDYWVMINYLINDINLKPDLIIVGLNLGAFNNDDIFLETINNKSLNQYLNLSFSYKLKAVLKSFKNSINTNYLRDIIISLFKIDINPAEERIAFLPNGQIEKPFDYTNDTEVIDTTYSRAYNLFKNLENIDIMRKLYLENFISFANQNDIKIKLVLLPMPPQTIEKLRQETSYDEIYAELKRYIDELHLAYQFEFYDFSEVKNFDGFKDNFDDATHPGYKNTEKITKLIFQSQK